MIGAVSALPSSPRASFFAASCASIERQHVLAVGSSKSSASAKPLVQYAPWPSLALSTHVPLVLLRRYISEMPRASDRAAVGPAADFQSEPCAAAFQCAEADFACHEFVPVLAKCRDGVCEVPMKAYDTLWGYCAS